MPRYPAKLRDTMTPEQKAAFVMAQAACAMAEIAGMQAENQHRTLHGNSNMYGEEAFSGVMTRYTIGHNDVMALFQN